LFLFEVSSLRTLNELISEVFVPHLQVVERVSKGSDFLLALANLSIELVSLSLQLFLFLSGFDNVVSLGVLADSLYFSRRAL
jgi:hypothetical protein